MIFRQPGGPRERGADKVITDAIDTHVQAEKRGNDGADGAA
jgi:hypothetical protein